MKQELLFTNPSESNGFDSGLIAFYKLNGNVIDESGNRYDGSVNGAIYNANGKEGGCYEFEKATKNNIELPSTISDFFYPPNSFTISAWVNAFGDSPNEGATVFHAIPDYYCHTHITLKDSFLGGNVLYYGDKVGNHINLNQWYHVVLVWDNVSAIQKIYINGVQETTIGFFGVAGRAKWCGLGNCERGDLEWDGLIDYVRLYNYAKSENEIIESLKRENIPCSKVGEFTELNSGISMVSNGQIREMKYYETDPYWSAFFKASNSGWK